MRFFARVEQNRLNLANKGLLRDFLRKLVGKSVSVDIEPINDKRTLAQNRAIHKLFGEVAKEMQRQGITLRVVLQKLQDNGFDIQMTEKIVKEIWRVFQKAQVGKESSVDLDKQKEIDLVYEDFIKFCSEEFSIYIPFPSLETLENEAVDK